MPRPPTEIERQRRVPLRSLDRSEQERVTSAFDSLTPEQREALELAFFSGISPDEISSASKCPSPV
jgi:DNA-directed RNA polymerase specialized sigma24 family protein